MGQHRPHAGILGAEVRARRRSVMGWGSVTQDYQDGHLALVPVQGARRKSPLVSTLRCRELLTHVLKVAGCICD